MRPPEVERRIGNARFVGKQYGVSVHVECPNCGTEEKAQVIAVTPENTSVSKAEVRLYCPECKKIFRGTIRVNNVYLEIPRKKNEQKKPHNNTHFTIHLV